jgi:hypothetical protein
MSLSRLVPVSVTIAAIAGGILFALAAPVGTSMLVADGTTTQTPPPPVADTNPWNN